MCMSGNNICDMPKPSNNDKTEEERDTRILQLFKDRMLKWLKEHDCNKTSNNLECIPGVDKLIRNIESMNLKDVMGHLFHAYLVRQFHENDVFIVTGVESDVDKNTAPIDIKLCNEPNIEKPKDLFIEAWYGKSRFSHQRDKLERGEIGGIATRLDDDAKTVIKKLEQLPQNSEGFVINYVFDKSADSLPIADSCQTNKCVITVTSHLRAYIYGSSDFQHMQDVRRICCIFGWHLHDMLGKVDVTAKALMKEHISIKEHVTAVVNKKNPSVK